MVNTRRTSKKKAYTHPNHIRRHTRTPLLRLRQLLMRRRRRMNHQRLRIAHVRKIACQLQSIHDLITDPNVFAALYTETQHSSELAFPQQLLRQRVRWVVLKARISDP